MAFRTQVAEGRRRGEQGKGGVQGGEEDKDIRIMYWLHRSNCAIEWLATPACRSVAVAERQPDAYLLLLAAWRFDQPEEEGNIEEKDRRARFEWGHIA